MKRNITLIVAYSANRAIGLKNKLPWHLPTDLMRFKALTQNHSVIMGRKTWESLGCKALPGRRNIVVSTRLGYKAHKAEVVHSFEQALELTKGDPEPFVIGGEQLYRKALPYANRIYVTEIHDYIEGDAFFPTLQYHKWTNMERIPVYENGYNYTFMCYERLPEVDSFLKLCLVETEML